MPQVHYCHCGKWGSFGTPQGWFCREHRPVPLGGANYQPERGRARRTDPDTSHEAAAHVDATRLELEVLDAVKLYGPPRGQPLCVAQLHGYLPHHPVDSLSPRMCKLVEKGLVRDLGKQPRPNRYGRTRNQHVYEAIREGDDDHRPPQKNTALDLKQRSLFE